MYEAYLADPQMVEDVLQVTSPLVKFCMFGDKPVMDQVERDWPQREQKFRFIRSGDYFVDVMKPQVTKGRALRRLAEIWQSNGQRSSPWGITPTTSRCWRVRRHRRSRGQLSGSGEGSRR